MVITAGRCCKARSREQGAGCVCPRCGLVIARMAHVSQWCGMWLHTSCFLNVQALERDPS
jgi:hypothetical protein